MRRRFVFLAYLCLIVSVVLFTACGSTSNSSSNNSNSGSSGTGSGSGSGSAGSGSGSAGSGSGGSGSAGSGGSSSGSGSSSSSVAYIYTASPSTISGFAAHSSGTLTPVSGSPYAASTAQNTNIVTNGANLYAIAEGSTNLDIFSINKSSGALTSTGGTSTITGDPNQGDPAWGLALDHTGASLYVDVGVPDQSDGINAFTVGSGSSAQQFQYLATGAFVPPPLVFSPNNQFAYSYTCFYRSSGVYAYSRASDGTLKALNLGPVTEPRCKARPSAPERLRFRQRVT